jgi:hypothetical protein
MRGVKKYSRLSVLVFLGFCLAVGFFGANSVATALTVNVKTDLGGLGCPDGNAVGDGVADDTNPIQWAINYVIGQGGGTVYCPPGTYKVVNLEVNDGADLAGAGMEQTYFRPNPADWSNALLYLKGGSMRNFTVYGSFPEDSGEKWRCGNKQYSGPANVIKAQPVDDGALVKGVHATEGRFFTFYTRGTKGLKVVDCVFDRGETIVAMDAKDGYDKEFVFANCVIGPWRDNYTFDIEPDTSAGKYVADGVILNCKFIGADSGDYDTNINLWGCFLGFKGFSSAGAGRNVAVVGCDFKDVYIYINKVFPDCQFSYNRIDGDYPIFARTSDATVGSFPNTIVRGNYFVGKRYWSQIACGVDFPGSSTFRCNTPSGANWESCSRPDCNAADLALLESTANVEDLSFSDLMRLCTNCPRQVLEHFYSGVGDWPRQAAFSGLDNMKYEWLREPIEPNSNGLIGWWKLDGDANDSSGHNNHGTVVGYANYDAGRIDQAIHIVNGKDKDVNHVEIGGDESDYDLTDAITVAAWIKMTTPSYVPNGYSKTRNIVAKGGSAWNLYMWSEGRVKFHCGGLSVGTQNAMGGVDVSDRLWHHVAGTYDGSKICVYVDGVLEDSLPATGSISTNDYKVSIGNDLQDPNEAWTDFIDDVRIYNYALSEEEIMYLAGLQNDLYEDGHVNFMDFAVLGSDWLKEEGLWPYP